MLKAAIFDMDGLMIDSEVYWQQAELDIMQPLGVPITRQDTIDTQGIRIDEIVARYHKKYGFGGVSADEVSERILYRVIELVKKNKPIMPGLSHALSLCKRQGLSLALASSSPKVLIDATIEALSLEGTFETMQSAEHLAYGKPHPEVYLNAAKALGVSPLECIAFEDSFTGLLAAKAAQMKTIVVPEKAQQTQARFVIADHQLPALTALQQAHFVFEK